ncbi:MAG TPA: hypothetical protein DCK98_14945 [Chloroflexi bacterium]|nr:hypothetical protein [Chloroflexota bacterium]HAL27355.1 hypothetical protein [Chloroflexota bacterium]
MPVRAAMLTDLPRVTRFLASASRDPDAILGSVLPQPLVSSALAGWWKLLPGTLGMRGRLRLYVEEYRGRLCAVALIYSGRRPEWVILALAAVPDPSGAEGSFKLLSHISASAAQHGQLRLFGAVADAGLSAPAAGAARARETFFQAGFYSYTRETWFAAPRAPLRAPARTLDGHYARRRDAHDLFRFYAATTPHAVQRAEQLTVEDFDIGRRAGAFDPPFLVSGNPLAMRRETTMVVGAEPRLAAFGVSFRGLNGHPHVVKARSVDGDIDLARDVVRATTLELPGGRLITSPVRSYEEHVARALLSEGFREVATAMLFVKELAVRIEEPALAPAVVR